MALAPISTSTQADQNSTGANYQLALMILTSLFFMWGFITSLNDILIPHLRGVFELTYTQAMMVQFCFFFAYFVCSMPAGYLVKRIGYQKGIVGGLLIAASGCLFFIPAATVHSYALFLFALFVLASGITLLQVSANPFVTLLGSPTTAASRLNLTQAFNSLGTTVAPFFGAYLILMGGAAAGADSVKLPYLILAACLIALAVFFLKIRLPAVNNESETSSTPLLKHKHLSLGAVAIFFYVGAEVAIGSFIINFLNLPSIVALAEEQAAHYVAYYWGCAMVGRFIGVAIMRKIAGQHLLVINGCCAVVLLLTVVFGHGWLAGIAIIAIGLFNSIMFPTLFSLALGGLGANTSRASGLLCLAIVGGAIVPLLQGVVADTTSLQLSFFIPALCYSYIIFYGLKGYLVK